jgi:hypothetical protein
MMMVMVAGIKRLVHIVRDFSTGFRMWQGWKKKSTSKLKQYDKGDT